MRNPAGREVSGLMVCFGVLFALASGLAASAQTTGHREQAPNGTGMYGTYVEKRIRYFSDSLGRAYPIPIDDLVPELMLAIERLSRYPVPESMPRVYRVAHEKIEELACGRKCPALGAYKPGDGIYLDEALQPETNIFARSVLLHELVHYAQDMSSGMNDIESCDRWYQREKEAYAIQENFLALVSSEHRVSYSTLFGYSALLDCDGIASGESGETANPHNTP